MGDQGVATNILGNPGNPYSPDPWPLTTSSLGFLIRQDIFRTLLLLVRITFTDSRQSLGLYRLSKGRKSELGNFLRRLALPKSIKDWSLRTMREKLVKIGAKVVKHARYVTFQMAEVLILRSLFHEILEQIHRLKPIPIESG